MSTKIEKCVFRCQQRRISKSRCLECCREKCREEDCQQYYCNEGVRQDCITNLDFHACFTKNGCRLVFKYDSSITYACPPNWSRSFRNWKKKLFIKFGCTEIPYSYTVPQGCERIWMKRKKENTICRVNQLVINNLCSWIFQIFVS